MNLFIKDFFPYVKLQVTWGCNIPTVMNVQLCNMNSYKWMSVQAYSHFNKEKAEKNQM